METLENRAMLKLCGTGCEMEPPIIPRKTKEFDTEGFRGAYLYAVHIAERDPFFLSEEDVKIMHRKMFLGINTFAPGEYRKEGETVMICGHIFPSPTEIPSMMEAFVRNQCDMFQDPIEAAALFHQGLVDIHPFRNGNGRVARLCMNAILLHFGYHSLFVTADWKDEYVNALHAGRIDKLNKHLFPDLIRAKVEENEAIYTYGGTMGV